MIRAVILVAAGLAAFALRRRRETPSSTVDITERKQAEEALRASEARYRTLFEHAPDGILIADPESYYLDANASMCRMLGYTRDELIGLHASDIVSQTEIQHIGPALSVIKAKSDYHREWQFRRKDGSVFAAEVIATTMPDGNCWGWSATSPSASGRSLPSGNPIAAPGNDGEHRPDRDDTR